MVLWGGLLTTLSQSSFAALLLGLAVVAWLRCGRYVVAPALVRALVAPRCSCCVPERAAPRARLLPGVNKATSGRYDLMEGGLRLARAKPLLGWGAGASRTNTAATSTPPAARRRPASHTIPITVAAEQGVLGFAAYVALLVLASAGCSGRARGSPARAAIAAGFVALVLHSWLYAAFLEDPMTWTLLAWAPHWRCRRRGRRGEEDAAASLNGHRRNPWSWRARSRDAASHARRARRVGARAGRRGASWAITRTYPNYDSYYHLVWGRRVARRETPSFEAYAAADPAPAVRGAGRASWASVFGESADRAAGARLPALARAAGVRDLSPRRGGLRALERRAGGAVRRRRAPRSCCTRRAATSTPRSWRSCVWAAVREAEGRDGRSRCSSPPGLLRPEAWVLAALWWLGIAALGYAFVLAPRPSCGRSRT